MRFLSRLKRDKKQKFNESFQIPNVRNVVVTMKVASEPTVCGKPGQSIHPNHAVSYIFLAEKKPHRFASATLRYGNKDKPTSTVLSFTTVFNSVGGATEMHSKLSLHLCRLAFTRIGYPLQVQDVTLHNEVFSGTFGHPIDIERLQKEEPIAGIFCPEKFPGLVYFHPTTKHRCSVMLVFASGRWIVMAIREKGTEMELLKNLAPIIKNYELPSKKLTPLQVHHDDGKGRGNHQGQASHGIASMVGSSPGGFGGGGGDAARVQKRLLSVFKGINWESLCNQDEENQTRVIKDLISKISGPSHGASNILAQ